MHEQRHVAGSIARRVRSRTGIATALIAFGGLCAPAAGVASTWPFPVSGAPPTVTVIGSSIIASGMPAGRTTVQATRTDAANGKPVVIGQFSATASRFSPFTVNTSAPTSLRRGGDCWQRGALASAITPDLRQGDQLTFAGTSLFGTPPTTTVTVGTPASGTRPGPAPVCATLAPWARNAITGAPTDATGDSVTVSGVAQPFATRVSVSASDGSTATAPAEDTPSSDGSWSATIALDALANGTVTVTPVFTVPDVSTAASARIAGASITLTKRS